MLPSILIVDDEPEVLKSLTRILKKDFTVYTFESAEKALEFFELNPTHIVLSDMRMPGMQGEEFLSQIHILNPSSKCCILTGHADIEATEKAINDAGISAYFSKPWDNTDLINKLKELTLGLVAKQKTQKKLKSLQKNKSLTELSIDAMLSVITGMLEEQEAKSSEIESKKRQIKQLLTLISSMITPLNDKPIGHENRVSEQGRHLGQILGLPIQQCINIQFAALFYRIGTIGIENRLLNSPRNSLSFDELKLVQGSVNVSAEMLSTVDILRPCSEIVTHLYDFLGKDSEQSPSLETKILKVIILFDDLVAGNITGQKIQPDKAKTLMKEQYHAEIDSKVLHHFIELLNKKNDYIIERAHSVNELRVNMVLSQDLYQANGTKLLVAGAVLNQKIIEKLISIEEHCDECLIIYAK